MPVYNSEVHVIYLLFSAASMQVFKPFLTTMEIKNSHMVVKSINLITKTEKQLSKFLYKSKSTQNYKCRNRNSFGANDNGRRSWPTSPCLQDFSNSGVYLTVTHPRDGIWWPGALADSARQFRLLFVHLNAHPDMSAVCNENALLCWKGKRGE